jgi:hypothetical protein
MTVTIHMVDDDNLVNIFEFLTQSEVLKLRRTCTFFHQLINSSHTWNRRTFVIAPVNINVTKLLGNIQPLHMHLTLTGPIKPFNNQLAAIGSGLRSFVLNLTTIDEKDLLTLLTSCHSLNSLSLRSVTFESSFENNFWKEDKIDLREIVMENFLHANILAKIIGVSPNLESIRISMNSAAVFPELYQSLSSVCKNRSGLIKSISLSNCIPSTEQELIQILEDVLPEKIYLHGCSRNTALILKTLSRFRQLTNLYISDHPVETPNAFEYSYSRNPIVYTNESKTPQLSFSGFTWSNLLELNLKDYTVSNIEALLSATTRLEKLTIDCVADYNEGVSILHRRIPLSSLKQINFLTSPFSLIIQILEKCTSAASVEQILCHRSATKIDDTHLQKLFQLSPQLKTLDIASININLHEYECLKLLSSFQKLAYLRMRNVNFSSSKPKTTNPFNMNALLFMQLVSMTFDYKTLTMIIKHSPLLDQIRLQLIPKPDVDSLYKIVSTRARNRF